MNRAEKSASTDISSRKASNDSRDRVASERRLDKQATQTGLAVLKNE